MSGLGHFLTGQHIARIASIYHQRLAGTNDHVPLHAIVTAAEAARNDDNFSPGSYVSANRKEKVLPLDEAVMRLLEAKEERLGAGRTLNVVLTRLCLLSQNGL